jgi:hypothetical protein
VFVENICDNGTLPCLRAQDNPAHETLCSQCAIDNGCLDPAQQGGTCEGVPGTAPAACASLIGVPAPSETQVCLATLQRIFGSGCAASLQETPCLCGDTDPAQCLSGNVAPNKPIFPLYQCDFGTPSVPLISTNFTVPLFGVGQANAIVQCAAAYGCHCF